MRSFTVAERRVDRNRNAGPTAWCDGRIVGGWSQDAEGRVHVQLFEGPGRSARQALQQRARELTEWLDGVRVSPRFPSPLPKTAVDWALAAKSRYGLCMRN